MKLFLLSIGLFAIACNAIPYGDDYYYDDTSTTTSTDYGDYFITPKGYCEFDLPSYTGGWFSTLSSYYVSQTFEKGCICPVAYYSTNKTNEEYFDVTNSCIRNGVYWKMQGYAYPAAVNSTGNYNVHFSNSNAPPSYSGNYVVLKVWYDEFEDYTYALVGSQNRNNWWLLSRTPYNDDNVTSSALEILERWNYNVENYYKPMQKCIFLGGHDGVNLVENS